MDFGQSAERLMGMNDDTWLRHAHPFSGWSRMATTPLLFLAAWSYVWIGWLALAPVAVLSLWLWFNPRVFPKPKSADAWMTKGVLGERVWLNRKAVAIPVGFARVAIIANSLSGVLTLLALYGLAMKDFWMAFLAWHFAAFAKIWFVDRMAWLWEVMKDRDPQYRAWTKALIRP